MEQQRIYNAAIYCRLSKDDEQAGESISIGTQKSMLESYCREQGFLVYDYYIDDGYSGLNFNRPGFERMLNDIDNGKVNLVITKDLSRLGRDYIQTGYYTEVYFSRKHVRYIALNDRFDSMRDDNDIAPFKNILNDMYAKDLSRKVKAAKRQRAKNGYYISAQAPYGYKVNPANKNQLVVDDEPASVVKEMFRLALAGNSTVQITKILTERKILIPSFYKAKNGDRVQ
jgi:site-specific DNA recombinase